MQRVAVFADAGYIFAAGSVLLTGTMQSREFLSLDIPAVCSALKTLATPRSDQPLLRVYWYDAMRLGRPTAEQSDLAASPDIKTRLGQVNAVGQQKGVDALIITDMIELARNHAMSDAVLVSGDEDVRVGVLLAQQFGVRVHLLGIQPKPGTTNQSRSLVQESDTTTEWNETDIRAFLRYTPPVTPTPAAIAAIAAAATTLEALIEPLVTAIPAVDLAILKETFATSTRVPIEHDRALLRVGRAHHGQSTLLDPEKNELRTIFVRLVLAR
jgi:uncharacterized LabA/DUF88 family protein